MGQFENTIRLFEDMASAISAKYLANVKIMTVRQGGRPDFDDLMTQLKQLEQELTKTGVSFVEEYKPENSSKEDITTSLKEIIQKTIESFIKQL
ncbi:MAG: hypothetical protein KDC07_04150 [Chitinophagaceae bacterium]|nr:hypothetical protein [Chitinophagaceae bacterium]MCB9047268.1 hypothetical protein [Chitinophagales bacterium]